MKIIVTTASLAGLLPGLTNAGATPAPVCLFKAVIPDPGNTGNNAEAVSEFMIVGALGTTSGVPSGRNFNNVFKIVDPSLSVAAFEALVSAGYLIFLQVVDFED